MNYIETPETNNAPIPLDIDPIKENRIPVKKPLRVGFEKKGDEEFVDTDEEIDMIRKEIYRLSTRLDRLQSSRVERAKREKVAAESTKVDALIDDNRLGPTEIMSNEAKFLVPKSNCGVRRRGVSLGPMEILELGRLEKPKETPFRTAKRVNCDKLGGIEEEDAKSLKFESSFGTKSSKGLLKFSENAKGCLSNVRGRTRGVSLGPSEIVRGVVGARESKQKGGKIENGSRSLSVSPKSGRTSSAAKAAELRKGIVTVGARKIGRAEIVAAMADLKPKVLFQDGVKAVTCKKPPKSSTKARVVPSRYSLVPPRVSGDEAGRKDGKLSLLEIAKEKKKEVMIGVSGFMPDCVVDEEFEQKKQTAQEQEIPMDLEEGSNSLPVVQSPSPITEVARMLPRIKNLRCSNESPRDSGCVKRASQLVGRKFPFAVEEGEEVDSVNQILEFQE